jgi:hypothetical protein
MGHKPMSFLLNQTDVFGKVLITCIYEAVVGIHTYKLGETVIILIAACKFL